MLCEVHGLPNYTYLKLKMLGLCGVITINTSFQRAYECEIECCEHATTIVASKELAAIRVRSSKKRPTPSGRSGLSSL